MTRRRATATGFVAVLLWALLALFTVGSAPVPPLQLNALCFAIGGTLGLIWVLARGEAALLRRISWKVYAFGTAGLFGYHALYFSALRLAPAAEAGLIAYLWPLLIVLMSGLLPGERLRPSHVLGALAAFAGAALIVARGAVTGFEAAALPGYGLALLCALTWSSYSVLSRRLGTVPTASVAIFCLATAALSWPLHLAFEETVWPDRAQGWLSIAALGLGPVGLAFYVWDIGVKRGDIQLLGVASYAAPLLSTLVLVGAGVASPTPTLFSAALLITGGAALAARASRRAADQA
ncbi:DMT family transporter [Rhodovulum sp. MB263]|uniref:aromatic amino acid exporter YddG n=1 Tax=Rhodovulum sp. (strain MB263) TaxID=308754 RepID=UPI0009B7E004|nr:EamA family transporter [Rhodovulum sp. MB263]ARC89275.1 EamA family transporter [Rhodovulum sp. MB263]